MWKLWLGPYLCAALQQLLGDVDLAVDCGQVEARPAGGVPGVGVGAHLEEGAHRPLAPLPRRQQQGSPQLCRVMAFTTEHLLTAAGVRSVLDVLCLFFP